MTTQAKHKAAILRDLACILGKDDDLMPTEVDEDGADGQRWCAARDELVVEFERRANGAKDKP